MQPLADHTFFVDNSMLDLIGRCPWEAYAAIILRRRPAGDAPALRFGKFLHAALAYRGKRQGFGKPWDEAKMIRILEHWFRSTPCEAEGYRNLDNAIKVIRGYNAFYPREDFDICLNPQTGLPYVEQPFAVNTHETIRGFDIVYTGRIDDKIRFPDRTTFIMDHKTTKDGGDQFWLDQAVLDQYKGYIWADSMCTGEPECTGYFVDALIIRDSVQNAYFDDLTGRIKAGATASGRASKAVPVEFNRQRFYTKVPPGQIKEWYDNMLAKVDEFLYHLQNHGSGLEHAEAWPRHRSQHCVGKWGLCQFYNVCSVPAESRMNTLLGNAYEENTWSPLYGS